MSETRPLDVAIAAGGTAGHVNPALALAEELEARGHRVTFYGQTRRLEGTLVPQAGFELVPIEVSGIDRSRPWTAVAALLRVRRARAALRRRFREQGAPDVAVGFGAYVEVPLLGCCRSLGVPYVLHEQNSVAGLANRSLAPRAAAVCVSFPAARAAFPKAPRVVVTGNPVRRSVLEASRGRGRASVGAAEGDCVVLVFGGSLGAHHLNEGVVALKDELLARPGVRVVHSTGADDFAWASSALALSGEEAARWRVVPYIDDMGDKLAAADLVVSRAGASSVAEIGAVGVPSLLVPYPLATADHQTTNAAHLVDAGAAVLVPDDQVGTPAFSQALLGLVDDAAARSRMRERALGLGGSRAAASLADQVEDACRRG